MQRKAPLPASCKAEIQQQSMNRRWEIQQHSNNYEIRGEPKRRPDRELQQTIWRLHLVTVGAAHVVLMTYAPHWFIHELISFIRHQKMLKLRNLFVVTPFRSCIVRPCQKQVDSNKTVCGLNQEYAHNKTSEWMVTIVVLSHVKLHYKLLDYGYQNLVW